MSTIKDKTTSVSDPEERQLGGAVPAPGRSTSYYGPTITEGFPAGSSSDNATVEAGGSHRTLTEAMDAANEELEILPAPSCLEQTNMHITEAEIPDEFGRPGDRPMVIEDSPDRPTGEGGSKNSTPRLKRKAWPGSQYYEESREDLSQYIPDSDEEEAAANVTLPTEAPAGTSTPHESFYFEDEEDLSKISLKLVQKGCNIEQAVKELGKSLKTKEKHSMTPSTKRGRKDGVQKTSTIRLPDIPPDERFHENSGSVALTPTDLAVKATGRIISLEFMRAKSTNLHGVISNRMKLDYKELLEIVRALNNKASMTEDSSDMRRALDEAKNRCEWERQQRERHRDKVKELSSEVRRLKEELDSVKIQMKAMEEREEHAGEFKKPPLRERRSPAPGTSKLVADNGAHEQLHSKEFNILNSQMAELRELIIDIRREKTVTEMPKKEGKISPLINQSKGGKKTVELSAYKGENKTKLKPIITENKIINLPARTIREIKRATIAIDTDEDSEARLYSTVAKNRKKKTKRNTSVDTSGAMLDSSAPTGGESSGAVGGKRPSSSFRNRARTQPKPRTKKKVLNSSVVAITNLGDTMTSAQVLRAIRDSVDLKALGIESSMVRKALNGGILIEIKGTP